MSEQQVGVRMTADASGFVGGVKKSEDSLKSLTETQKKASAEADAYTKRLQDQAATFGRSESQIRAYRASQMDMTKAQQDQVAALNRQIDAQEKHAPAMAAVTRLSAAAGVAVAAYAASSALAVKHIIDEQDELLELSQRLGMSTEALSAHRYQMSLAGASNEEFTYAMQQLAKNLQEAASGTGNGAQLFASLGVSIRDARGEAKSMEEILPEIADSFARFADGPNKSALAMALLGREGTKMIPALNEGAAGMRAAAEEAQRLNRIVGGDAAKSADEFNDNLRRLEAAATAGKHALANELLPALVDITNEMVRGHREGGLLLGIFEGLQKSAQYAAGVGSEQQELDGILARLRERYTIMQRLNSEAGAGARNEGQRGALQAEINALEADRNRLAAVAAINNPVNQYGDAASKPTAGKPQMATFADEQSAKAAQDLIKSVQERVALMQQQAASGDKLTETDQMQIKVQAALADGTLKLNAAQREKIEDGIAAMRVAEDEVDWQKQLAEAQKLGNEYLIKQGQIREQLRASAMQGSEDPLANRLNEIGRAYSEGVITADEWGAANQRAFAQFGASAEAAGDKFELLNESIKSGALKSAQALADWATGGKMTFRDFSRAVINDLIRIQTTAAMMRVGGALSSILSSAFAPGPSPGLADSGGTDYGSPFDTGLLNPEVQASPYHSGGVAGVDRGAARRVPASAFAGAPRYHV